MNKRARALTLIELLVVVSIISVLAGIALPSLLEARVRSQVARVKADHAAIAGALEAYTVDWGQEPRMTWMFAPYDNTTSYGYADNCLSTPVAYIGSVSRAYQDPFATEDLNVTPSQFVATGYLFHGASSYARIAEAQFPFGGSPVERPAFARAFRRSAGSWALSSLGPDLSTPDARSRPYWTIYDPTNGTISAGNIFRTQREPEPQRLDFEGAY